MNFSSDAMADFEGLLEVNRKICQQQIGGKGIAYAANELCGCCLNLKYRPAELRGKPLERNSVFVLLKSQGNTAQMSWCDGECIFCQMRLQKSKVYWR